ncbi:polysaccharide biosynthesis tyrosine autokinase [Micromonospora gifhornensis]|uniref:Capsular exopolysaccharide family n=1 Tax=Micromonospora gifhornensis TaxID=84594 RepID=A0ABQ4IGE4_9ACTN|nr:polysaccharide biosynthesis tyrosine autokinase [Micromonospora gifhornensis]GIJ16982.1 hypothetical protein Vgi01_36660 [Micromonospora gifhornensis]
MRLSRSSSPAEESHPASGLSRHLSRLGAAADRSLLVARQWAQLTPRHHLRAVRDYRLPLVILVLLGGAGGALASLTQTPTYKASAQLFFSPNFDKPDVHQLNAGGNYILQRVRSYSEIANSPTVAAAVTDRLGLGYSPEELMSKVTVTGKASTAVLDVEVRDSDPQRARDIANTIADELPGFITQLEQPTEIETPPIKVSVVRAATTPSSPESPRPLVNVGLGLAGGLFVGVGAAILRYAGNRTVRDEQHAAEVAELTLLGTVATGPDVSLTAREDSSATVETFRQIRTNIRLQQIGQQLTSLAVTGCGADDGQAAVAGDLALAFARAGETVVLVDGNLREPQIHKLFAVPNEAGLAAILAGTAGIDDVIVKWRPDLPLYVLPAGGVESSPPEQLYRPDRLANLLESFRLGRVLVVVSTPPPLSDVEATTLVSATSATLVVCRVGVTPAEQLSATGGVLRRAEANLLGVIVTRPAR